MSRSSAYEDRARRHRRARALQIVRVVSLVAIVLALRDRHLARAATRSAAPPDAAAIADAVPSVSELGEARFSRTLGAHWATNDPALVVASTSPVGDGERGYSGATSLVLAFDGDDRCRAARVQWSDDTSEHVEHVVASGALDRLRGRSATELADVELDAATGATLTSRAIERALAARFGGGAPSVFSREERESWSATIDAASEPTVARVLVTSPAADDVIGYGGPSAAALLLDERDRIVDVLLLQSFDNDPYVGYVRDEAGFAARWHGATLGQLAEGIAPDGRALHAGLDGVSGATMTAMAVLEGAQYAAATDLAGRIARPSWLSTLTWRDLVSAVSLLAALVLHRWARRSPNRRKVRRVALLLVIVGVGLVGGHLVSLAQLIGLAERGVAGYSMLLVLAAIALLAPLVRSRNVYCHDLCPHGALQRFVKPRSGRAPSWWESGPFAVLIGAVLWLIIRGELDATTLEPFDAWSLGLGAPISATVFVVGLLMSRRIPMAYCRFGCPTGAILGSLGRSIPRLSPWGEVVVSSVLAVIALLAWA